MSFIPDYHVHTSFSPDGESDINECIAAAKKNHITDLIITDHFECNSGAIPPQFEQWPLSNPKAYYNILVPYYNQSDINFGIGIELGQPLQNRNTAEYFINSYKWDFVLGSLHNIKNEYDFYFIDFSSIDINKLFQSYFEELYDMVEWGQFDVLSHFFYFIRYIPQDNPLSYLNKYEDIIVNIFKKCISKGIGVEVNTSALRSKLGITIPDLKFLKQYRQLGGELVTIGSDAHKASDIGSGCLLSINLLKEAGFRYLTKYINRNPYQVKI